MLATYMPLQYRGSLNTLIAFDGELTYCFNFSKGAWIFLNIFVSFSVAYSVSSGLLKKQVDLQKMFNMMAVDWNLAKDT